MEIDKTVLPVVTQEDRKNTTNVRGTPSSQTLQGKLTVEDSNEEEDTVVCDVCKKNVSGCDEGLLCDICKDW